VHLPVLSVACFACSQLGFYMHYAVCRVLEPPSGINPLIHWTAYLLSQPPTMRRPTKQLHVGRLTFARISWLKLELSDVECTCLKVSTAAWSLVGTKPNQSPATTSLVPSNKLPS
jgi:hypothetical protein